MWYNLPMQIALNNVSYTYSLAGHRTVVALNGVTFSIEKGEHIALIGSNGSGKSTLAKLLNGLYYPVEGNITVDQINTKEKNKGYEIRRKVGVIFQNPENQIVATIVEDDVAFGPENLGMNREEMNKCVDWALNKVNMQENRHRMVTKLSGGQKQRVAIAGVLAMKPDVIVFDESTAMLDPKGKQDILDVMRDLKNEGITIIHITHSMEEVVDADKVLVLNNGCVRFIGTPADLFASENINNLGIVLPDIIQLANNLKNNTVIPKEEVILKEDDLVESLCKRLLK